MRLQASIPSIALGGRSTHTGAIQAVGGTKGSNNYAYGDILSTIQTVKSTLSPAQNADPKWKILNSFTNLPINRSTDTSLNVRDDVLRPNLLDGIPAQFVVEEADCRLYYEKEMIVDFSKAWERAADVAWGGGKCVAGSIKYDTDKKARSEVATAKVRFGVANPNVNHEDVRKRSEAFAKRAETTDSNSWSLWQARHGRKIPV